MIFDEDDVTWFDVWCVEDGDVVHHEAYEDGDSIVFKDAQELYDEDDPRHIHVDALTEGRGIFDNENDAKKYAITWLKKKIKEFQIKLAHLQTK